MEKYKTVLDIETTVTFTDKKTNPSPYLATNKLVSVGVLCFNSAGELLKEKYWVVDHKEYADKEALKELQVILNETVEVIGHSLKFDMSWLYECGITYEGKLYDTMITEYVFAQSQKISLKLKDCCDRYNLPAKLDILSDYLKQGINVDEIPIQELVDYGQQDIRSTHSLYEHQQKRLTDCGPFGDGSDEQYMLPAIQLMDELLPVLIDMERTGIFIDLDALSEVEKEYREEAYTLDKVLREITTDVMGHTPINLESSEHLSWVLYSRKVKDKKSWKEKFNLGSEIRGNVRKLKYATKMLPSVFARTVKEDTDKLYRTEASQCSECHGKGKIQKYTKKNVPHKKENICKTCKGAGLVYTPTKKYAGLKLKPISSEYAATGGFSTDKVTIGELLKNPDLKDEARDFLTGLLRLNAVQTYLSTFVLGIQKNVITVPGIAGGILHTSFNQCITATGRLSSSNPNFQNLPRGKTFPVRKVIKSRFKDGKIISVDFKQLEFRVAVILGKDAQGVSDIISGADIHQFTADTITRYGQPTDRQTAKSHTFKPLFAGSSGTDAEQQYYKEFNKKYSGIATWQQSLCEQALATGKIKSPSGRIYAFPNVKRMGNGRVRGQTQIYNYIIQGFATGDVNPIALIEIHSRMKALGLKSKLVLTVHDDISCDTHPDEIDTVLRIYKEVFSEMDSLIEERFGVKCIVPIEGEISMGDNWLEKKVIP